MARRALANKFIMVGIIITLIGFIGLIVYIQWFSGNGDDDADAKHTAGGGDAGSASGGAADTHDRM